MLTREREVFERSFDEWMREFPGKVALVKGETLIGAFDTENEALAEGARLYGSQPFLAIGAPVIDVVGIPSASHAAHQANVYPVRFEVTGLPIARDAPRAVGAALQAQGIIMLIGRDLLQYCTLFCNGVAGEFTLSI